MSTIRKIPFIESVLSGLSKGLLNSLKIILDSNESNVELGFGNLPTINTITPTNFKLDVNNKKSGILIYTSDICVLIAYHRFQDLQLFKLNVSNSTYEKINEYCDINELRRILDDSLETVGENILNVETSSGELEDSDIEALKLPNAAIEYNDTIYYKDTQDDNEIVFKALPRIDGDTTYLDVITIDLSDNTYTLLTSAIAAGEGFTPEYDTELSNNSTNAVQNKTIVGVLEDYAKKDGNYPTMTVGAADNLTPYSEDSGAEQSKPFITQGTGTDNNTAIVTTGALGLLKEKQGNSVAVNQFINTNNYPSVENSFTNGIKVSAIDTTNGTITIVVDTGGATGDRNFKLLGVGVAGSPALEASHKYLQLGCPAGGGADKYYFGISANSQYGPDFGNGGILTNYSSGYVLAITIKSGCPAGTYVFRPRFIGLTQWYSSNDNIPADLLSHPENWYRYYNGDLSYNVGSLENANGVKLVCTQGRNLWDEEWEVLYTNYVFSKNHIKVLPNTTYYYKNGSVQTSTLYYYDKAKNLISQVNFATNNTFTTPNNCYYIMFSYQGTAYNNNITISLYYSTGEGYDKYYPYVASKLYDTGSEELLAFDKKTHDGTIYRNTGEYSFTGSESWFLLANGSAGDVYYATILPSESPAKANLASKVQSSNGYYGNNSMANAIYTGTSLGIGFDNRTCYVCIPTGSLPSTVFASGVKLQYELATPTTEQGTSFSENIEISDYGMMYWLDSNDNLVGIPQGAKFFYPVDYKGFIDDVYARTNGDAQDIVVQDELNAEETARTSQDTILQNAIGGTLRQCLCVKETLDFDNTDVVDLGTLNWYYNSNGFMESSVVSNAKAPSSSTDTTKILSTFISSNTSNAIYNGTNGVGLHTDKSVRVRYSGMSTDATAFKAAMKGVLLAYEKASE